ncbi:MAG: GspE/PulE family protein [Nitrospiraceae bacterium]|nr:GspE/PulE family protein [Nitrospiraceae bacterium]
MDDKAKNLVLDILKSAGLLTEEQIKKILSNEDAYTARIMKTKSGAARRGQVVQHDINIIDVIDSLNLELPGSDGKYLTEDIIMERIASHLNLPFIKIDPLKLDADIVTGIVSRPYAIKHQLIPVGLSGNTLTIATSRPFQKDGIEWLRMTTHYDINVCLASKKDLHRIITEFYGFKSSVAAADKELSSGIDLGNLEQFVKLKPVAELGGTDKHIINAVEYMLHYAYSQRASDIHIEPKREHSLIRFRIDGVLHDIHKMPKAVHLAFVSRIKTLSRMDIAEKRRPQDGRIKTEKDDKEIELRISTLPVAFGEKVVIRIFDPSILIQNPENLGLADRDLSLFKSFISAPHGLILVTGPTGSGKTTTLYSAMKMLASPEVNITTIEDPIEMIYGEFNQTSVQHSIGVTFANALRTILRQDPDIIMVGEIRDHETAENAIQAALTGHLVLSTLHTNDAPSSITRLVDLGVPPFLINSTLIGIIAQRLVRKVCPECAEEYNLSKEECMMLGITDPAAINTSVFMGKGCLKCRGTGYYGRSGIFEVLEITRKIKEKINEKTGPDEIGAAAKTEGFRTLRECAVNKMIKGQTTFDEIIRAAGLHD